VTKSEELAGIVVDRCVEIGVREFVLCAGSRNSPLVLEILSRVPKLRVWTCFEERCAAFFALGRTRALDVPVAVITTSGTAAAELFPAVIEAHYQRQPLLCITADRPKSFRGSGAPQAIEQANLFGNYARNSWDIEADFIVGGYDGLGVFWDESDEFSLTSWDGWGPAQLNVCFCEPLLSESPRQSNSDSKIVPAKRLAARPVESADIEIDAEDLLVMLGSIRESDRKEVAELLLKTGAPILADATSGLRGDPDLDHLMLKSGDGCLKNRKPKAVLRIGGVPTSRFWRDLENLPEIRVVSVLANGFSGLARNSELVDLLESLKLIGKPETSILAVDYQRTTRLNSILSRLPASEPAYFRNLSQHIQAPSVVFLGNSMPIREWNLAARDNSRLSIHANRGANGIDGNLSTFLGLAAGAEEAWGIFGDLTTMYDLAAPTLLQQLLPTTKIRIVVINNQGGKIFSRLPSLAALPENDKQVIENHHEISFAPWAKMWNLDYRLVRRGDPIPSALPNRVVIEIQPDSAQTEQLWIEYAELD
jgi:2-succinyl-5-enolpyruvyl-6-hydroxy-3-cyclohexene-1-carboxylate synthase